MPKWNDYTTKTALKDNDELMILDKDANANKRTLMDKIWNYVVDKMTTAVIAKLGTTNKTLIGAVNELYSKPVRVLSKVVENGSSWSFTHLYHCLLFYGASNTDGVLVMVTDNSYVTLMGNASGVKITSSKQRVDITNNIGWTTQFTVIGL